MLPTVRLTLRWRLFCLLIASLCITTPFAQGAGPAAAPRPLLPSDPAQSPQADPLQQAYLKGSYSGTYNAFGVPLAIQGDTVVVRSAGPGMEDRRVGALYVFVRNNGIWTQQAYLEISDPDGSAVFIRSFDIFGDTLVVGAPYAGGAVTGAVYVFERSAGVWSQTAYLTASNAEAGDNFGLDVALEGDRLVVGATGEDSAATGVDGDETDNSAAHSGAAYVFERADGVWTQQAYLKASNTDPVYADEFGSSVALAGDTIAVSAPWEWSAATGIDGDQSNNTLQNAGAVYVFAREDGAWRQEAYIKASNTGREDQFGATLALSTDTLAVGAPEEDSAATGINGEQSDESAANSGAVYVFRREAGVWSQQAYLKASNTDTEDAFVSVALSGDRLLVGAPGEDSAATGVNGEQADNSAPDSGAVYLFERSDDEWSQQAYLKASNSEAGDAFGPVVLSGSTIVIGALGEDSNATTVGGNQADNSASNAGAAYVFTIPAPSAPVTTVPCQSNVYPILLPHLALEDNLPAWHKPVTLASIGLSADVDEADIPGLNTSTPNSPRFRLSMPSSSTPISQRFYFTRWTDDGGAAPDVVAMLSGAGNLRDGFQEYPPPPQDPAAAQVNGILEAGDWLHEAPTPPPAEIQAVLEAHIANKTRMILPVYDQSVGSGNTPYAGFRTQRFVEVRLLSQQLTGGLLALEFALIDEDKQCEDWDVFLPALMAEPGDEAPSFQPLASGAR